MKKMLPAIVIGLVAVIAIGFMLFNMSSMTKQSETPLNLNLPDKWQEFTRSTNKTGQDALGVFQKEHEKKISWKDGAQGEYSDGKAKFTVWIAGAVNDGHASQMVLDMASKIGKANQTFSEPKPVDLGTVKGYRLDGQGNTNFFYAKGRQVYWIGVNGAADPEALVKRILTDF